MLHLLHRSCLSSTSASEDTDQSTIVAGPSLLTQTGVHRPSPSLFSLPGLRSLPFWTAPDNSSKLRFAFNDSAIKHAVEHVESHYESIREEYFAAVLGQGTSTDPHSNVISKPLEPDYDLANKGGEHADDALHSGTPKADAEPVLPFLERFRNTTTAYSLHVGSWEWHSYIL